MQARVGVGAFALVAAVAFSATTAFAAVKITVWHSLGGSAQKAFEASVARFEAANPDIHVDVVDAGGYVAGRQKAQVAWAAGNPPNVAMFEQTRNMVFIDSGALLPLDGFIKGPNGIDLSDFFPPMLSTVTYNGKVYGLPYNPSTPLMYYNKDLFRATGLAPTAPHTWDELSAVSAKLARDKNGDGKQDVYGMDFYSWGWMFEAWLGENGASVMNADGTKFTFDSEPAVQAMQFLQDFVNKHHYGTAHGGYGMFWAGNLGMAERSTASLAGNIAGAQKAKMDMGVAPLVCNVQCYAPIGGADFVLFNTGTDAQKQASWSFLKFVTSTDEQAKFAVASGYMASRKSAYQSQILQARIQSEPRANATYLQIPYAHPRPKTAVWPDVASIVSGFYKTQFDGNVNVKLDLQKRNQQAQAILEDYLAHKHK